MTGRLRAWAEARTAPLLFAFGPDAPLEQMERYDAWRGEGAPAGAVLGVGLGEVAAAYAAGSLSRADATAVARALEGLRTNGGGGDVALVVAADTETAQRLCRAAPVRLHFAGVRSRGEAILVCSAADIAVARRHVASVAPIRAEREASGAWHANVAPPPSPLPDVAPRPAERPLYAAAAGGDVTGEILDGRYWRWLARRPFYLDEAATAAVDAGYLAVVDVGGDRDVPAAIKAEARARGRTVRVFDRPPPQRRTRRRSRPGPPSLLDPVFHEELRRDGPVHHLADRDVWLVVGYDEARTVLADPDRFSSRPFAVYDRSLLSLDPPEHTPPRRAVRDILSPARVAELARVSARIAAELVASVAEEPEFDVLARIARPLSERVIAHVLGIEPSAVPDLAAAAAGGGHEADFALTEQALERLPRPPALTPKLAAAPGIDPEQADALVRLLWVAGSVTTRRLIGVALLTLCEHQDARARVTEDPELLPAFVDETLRLRPPEHLFPRVAVTDTSLAGVPIPAGATVRVSLRAANRDPKRFPEPDRLRLDRPPRHLAFGAGPHRCPGARLGRVEALAALREILRAMPGVALAQPPSTIRWLQWPNSPVLEELVVTPSAAG